ncbi:MAG TPA: helix-turn-helix domain-containing protein [Actinoplanes sp.]|nr:helix-turn-helix domain-containing protein [Actinoplanes sp.]
MRADAQRNAVKLRTAAAELFQEHGLQVSLKEIARRAGVSHGTLYNLFGSREALIDEVIGDLAASRLSAAATRAMACDDPWTGFAGYLTEVCELQATDPALGDVLTRRFPDTSRLMAVCDNSYAATESIISRAHRDGSLRPDFTASDLLFFLAAHAPLARAAAAAGSGAWRRQITFLLDGLRTPDPSPSPAAPLTPDQINHLLTS